MALSVCSAAGAPNYDESKVGNYTLPDPLVLQNGEPVRDAETWYKQRRPEIVHLYETNIHGRSPGRPEGMTFDVIDVDNHALGGKAVRKQVVVNFTGKKDGPKMNMLIYLPADAKQPVPLFLCLNFFANHRICDDPGVKINEEWDRKIMAKVLPDEKTRGTFKGWQIDKILSRGYGIAIIYYCDIEPDSIGGMQYGVRPLFFKPGQLGPAPDEWGAIGAWAWGLSRGLDYLESDKDVDAKRVVAVGHSRLGKTVLWAGAQDTRFAMVIASCSGEMGGSLSRRNYGETVDDMIRNFPYQFCTNFQKYAKHWDEMPVDSHMLISLIAPRPLYLNTGSEDQWADPKGEFLAAVAAGPVYRLLGKQGLDTDQMPPLDTPIMHTLGFQCHTGKHEILPEDWDRFLNFADMHLKNRN
jgi:hypothetical protein